LLYYKLKKIEKSSLKEIEANNLFAIIKGVKEL